jgi:hypothetical protein
LDRVGEHSAAYRGRAAEEQFLDGRHLGEPAGDLAGQALRSPEERLQLQGALTGLLVGPAAEYRRRHLRGGPDIRIDPPELVDRPRQEDGGAHVEHQVPGEVESVGRGAHGVRRGLRQVGLVGDLVAVRVDRLLEQLGARRHPVHVLDGLLDQLGVLA